MDYRDYNPFRIKEDDRMVVIEGHKCSKNQTSKGAQWQDKKYGKNIRVANKMRDGRVRCTVCGEEILVHGKIFIW